jgi:two-component system response regulator YesN
MKSSLNINKNNLSIVFKYHFGRTPQDYWLYHRIQVSKQLLRHPEYKKINIGVIGMEVGFDSPAAFSRTFKRRQECTPKEWKNYNC